jgi:hypothetical protein
MVPSEHGKRLQRAAVDAAPQTAVLSAAVLFGGTNDFKKDYGGPKTYYFSGVHDESIRNYCVKHRCKYIKESENNAIKDRSPRWLKVAMIREYLQMPTKYQTLVWVDADAVFVNEDPLPDIAPKDLGISHDMKHGQLWDKKFNSGFMIIQSTDWSRAFWDQVWAHNDFGEGHSDQKSINFALHSMSTETLHEHVDILPHATYNAFPLLGKQFKYPALCIPSQKDYFELAEGDGNPEQSLVFHFAGGYGGYCNDGTFYSPLLVQTLANNVAHINRLIRSPALVAWGERASSALKKQQLLPVLDAEALVDQFATALPGVRKLRRPTVVWSMDMHISPIANAKALLEPMGVTFMDNSLSGHCQRTKTCAKSLKVLTRDNAEAADEGLQQQFAAAYKNDKEFQRANIFMCFHPSAMCEFFIPFMSDKRRIFVIPTTRYEMGRWSKERWSKWNQNLQLIASKSSNVVASNNHYDADYVEYFSGVKPIYLPSHISMTGILYTAESSDILVAPLHTDVSDHGLNFGSEAIGRELRKLSPRFKQLRTKYKGHYSYAQLASNTAILHIPYQVSVMSLFEQYAMAIPLLVPTPEFLWTLHNEYNIMKERTWQQQNTGKRERKSLLPPFLKDSTVPDPNDDLTREAFLFWVKKGDFWTFEHILTFDSWGALQTILDETDFQEVSRNMRLAHRVYLDETRSTWEDLLK